MNEVKIQGAPVHAHSILQKDKEEDHEKEAAKLAEQIVGTDPNQALKILAL